MAMFDLMGRRWAMGGALDARRTGPLHIQGSAISLWIDFARCPEL